MRLKVSRVLLALQVGAGEAPRLARGEVDLAENGQEARARSWPRGGTSGRRHRSPPAEKVGPSRSGAQAGGHVVPGRDDHRRKHEAFHEAGEALLLAVLGPGLVQPGQPEAGVGDGGVEGRLAGAQGLNHVARRQGGQGDDAHALPVELVGDGLQDGQRLGRHGDAQGARARAMGVGVRGPPVGVAVGGAHRVGNAAGQQQRARRSRAAATTPTRTSDAHRPGSLDAGSSLGSAGAGAVFGFHGYFFCPRTSTR